MQASGDLAGDVAMELEGLVCQLQSSMTESSSAGQLQHTSCAACLACVSRLHVCVASVECGIDVVIDISHFLTVEMETPSSSVYACS